MVDPPKIDLPKKIIFDNYDTVIEDIKIQAEKFYVYKYRLVDKKINFIAGQYVSVIVPGSTPAPFSIASSPEQHDMIELAIEMTGGPHTSKIQQTKVGDHTTLRGPFGTFVLGEEKKACFLSGGVGITPFMSMLRWIRDTKQDIQAVLFYSCRIKDQFLWMDELEQMIQDHPNIKIVFTVTREDPPDWKYNKGRITKELIIEKLPEYKDYTFYSCGPQSLIDGMFTILKELGLPDEKVKREKW